MSYLQATEAILYYRGKDLENSENYEVDKLIRWLKENIKLLRPIKKPELESQNFVPSGKSLLNKSVNIERSSLNGRQALSSQPNIRKSVKLEQFSNMIRGSQENMQLPSLKGNVNLHIKSKENAIFKEKYLQTHGINEQLAHRNIRKSWNQSRNNCQKKIEVKATRIGGEGRKRFELTYLGNCKEQCALSHQSQQFASKEME
eukprot:403350356